MPSFGDFLFTQYAPGPGDNMEGPWATSRPNPLTGQRIPSTLDDVRLGRSPFVTLASDPSRYGQKINIGSHTYRSPLDGKTYTLPNVTGIVHDTGSAFKGRPDKLDIATGDFRGWDPAQASAYVNRTARQGGEVVEGDNVVAGSASVPRKPANYPQPDRGQKMPSSLMDFLNPDTYQAQDRLGRPTSIGDAIGQNSNSLVGMGLGLLQMQPLGGSGMANALKGYQGGAALDQRSQALRQEDEQRKQTRADTLAERLQRQSNWQQEFARSDPEKQPTAFTKAARDLGLTPGTPEHTEFAKRFYTNQTEGSLTAQAEQRAAIAKARGMDENEPRVKAWIAAGGSLADKPQTMSVTDITKLSEEGGKLANISTFQNTFEPRFAGYKAGAIGGAANLAGRVLPEGVVGKDVSEGAAWWQGYDRYKNVVRNDLYGSALTPSEQRAFEQADIGPSMDPKQIQKNLAIQKEVVQNGVRRKASAMIENGQNPETIAKAYGISLKELGVAGKGQPQAAPMTPAAPAGPAATQTKTVNGKTYRKINGQWFGPED